MNKRLGWILALVVVGAVGYLAGKRAWIGSWVKQPSAFGGVAVPGNGGCPHYWLVTLTLAGSTADMPEYNDCQAFLVPDSSSPSGLKYGDVQAVLIRDQVKDVFDADDLLLINSTSPGGGIPGSGTSGSGASAGGAPSGGAPSVGAPSVGAAGSGAPGGGAGNTMHMKSQAAVSSSISTNAVAAQVSGLASQRLNTVSISINGAKAASFNFFGTPTVSASSGTVSISGTSAVLGAPANTNNAANTNNSATPGPAFISVTHTEPVAEVISNGDYAPLGIKKGFNCLILTWISPPTAVPISIADRRTAIKASYRAWMVPVALESQCLTIQSTLAIPPSPGSLQLAVNALDVATGDKIPAVTRWDWDSVSQKQYVGMICPTGWCEFHQPKVNFTSSRLHTPPVSMSPNGYLLGQKPWYDEQVLADPKSGSSGLRPSQQRVLGTLVPVPGLETRDMNFYKTGWQDAAWVALDKDDENYKSKYGFQKNNPVLSDAGKTTVALCYRQKATDTNCGTGIPTCEGNAKVLPDSGLFFARISGVNNANPKYFCVAYRPSKNNLQPPGVVRWRWTLKDETIWIACPAGCCEVDAIAS